MEDGLNFSQKERRPQFFSSLVILVLLNLNGRWPQLYFKCKTTYNLSLMEDDLNICLNGRIPQFILKIFYLNKLTCKNTFNVRLSELAS